MRTIQVITITSIILVIVAGYLFLAQENNQEIISPIVQEFPTNQQKPLKKYSFENLKKRDFYGSEITFGKLEKENSEIKSYLFYFTSENKKVSGLANIPFRAGEFPVVVMFRGYIDQKQYSTGDGTKRAGEVLAKRGFITLAPDFLGYGESASPSANPIEERFEKNTVALNLIASIKYLPKALVSIGATTVKVKKGQIGLWGHSNGGQIALSILAITTGEKYPTVLWAPVSKPFPYSILYYTDEYEDHGKALRKIVAEFEEDYDVEQYSVANFLDWIDQEAPIQLHQGGADDAVPQDWSDELYDTLAEQDLDIDYYTYPGEDHNFVRGSWATVISRTISFYNSHLLK